MQMILERAEAEIMELISALDTGGGITTSLIVNMPAFQEAKQMAEYGDYIDKVSFHFNISEGTSLSSAIRKSPFYRNGSFCEPIKKISCYFPSTIYAVRDECRAQMKLFRQAGFTSKCFDSHRWSHVTLPVWFAVKPLLKQYGFERIRPVGVCIKSKGIMKLVKSLVFKRINENRKSCRYYELQSVLQTSKDLEEIEVYIHPELKDGIVVDATPNKKGMPSDVPIEAVLNEINNSISIYNSENQLQ